MFGADIGCQQHEGTDGQIGQRNDADDLSQRDAAFDTTSSQRIGRDDDRDPDPDPCIAQHPDGALTQIGGQDCFLDQRVVTAPVTLKRFRDFHDVRSLLQFVLLHIPARFLRRDGGRAYADIFFRNAPVASTSRLSSSRSITTP